MSRSFDGKSALVIGAAQGIGAAVATALNERGAATVLVDPLDGVSDVARQLTGPADAVVGDATDPEVITRAIAAAHRLGPLSTLVYAAAHQPTGTVLEGTVDDWDRAHDVGVKGAWQAAAAFAREAGRPASIVLVSSIHAFSAYPAKVAYGTAKAALVALTRSLAVDLGEADVRCNAVAPAFIAVERNQQAWSDAGRRAEILAANPLHRLGEPADVANVVTFLASQEAAHVNGVCLPVDGGELAMRHTSPPRQDGT